MENAFHRVALPLPHPFVRCNKSRWPQTSWPLIHQYSYIARRQPQMSQQVSQHGELWWSSSKRWTSLFYILFIIRKLPMPMFFLATDLADSLQSINYIKLAIGCTMYRKAVISALTGTIVPKMGTNLQHLSRLCKRWQVLCESWAKDLEHVWCKRATHAFVPERTLIMGYRNAVHGCLLRHLGLIFSLFCH